MSARFHLAQANWARRVADLDDPVMAGFVARLDEINALADRSEGFVWRLQTDEGNSTGIPVFGDDELVFNMSVWESVEALEAYVYRSDHVQLIRDRGQWFHTPDRAPFVLWWMPAGTLPSVSDAESRFEQLWRDGPTPEAFTFRRTFPPTASVEHALRGRGAGTDPRSE